MIVYDVEGGGANTPVGCIIGTLDGVVEAKLQLQHAALHTSSPRSRIYEILSQVDLSSESNLEVARMLVSRSASRLECEIEHGPPCEAERHSASWHAGPSFSKAPATDRQISLRHPTQGSLILVARWTSRADNMIGPGT